MVATYLAQATWAGGRVGDECGGAAGRRLSRPGPGDGHAGSGRPVVRWCANGQARWASGAVAGL